MDLARFRYTLYQSLIKEYLSFLKGDTSIFSKEDDHHFLKKARQGLEMFKANVDNYVLASLGGPQVNHQEQQLKYPEVSESKEIEKQQDCKQEFDSDLFYACISRSPQKESPSQSLQSQVKQSLNSGVCVNKNRELQTAVRQQKQRDLAEYAQENQVFEAICQRIASEAIESKHNDDNPVRKIINLINFSQRVFANATSALEEKDKQKFQIGKRIISILSEEKVRQIRDLNRNALTRSQLRIKCQQLAERINLIC